MKSTHEIKERLTSVNNEIERIDKAIHDGAALSDRYTHSDGTQHAEWSYDDALCSYMAQLVLLEWILKP